MRTAIIEGAHQLSVADVAVPDPGPDEVRVAIRYAGICGSDLSYYNKGAVGAFVVKHPLVPGHEVSGVVDLDPSGELEPGTPVTLHPASPGAAVIGLDDRPNIWPGGRYLGSAATDPHTQGAMAQYFVARADQLRVLPGSLPLRRAALAEPLAVGLHAIVLAGDISGLDVLVNGAGPIGLLLAGAAAIKGARVTVSDVLPEALERAQTLGIGSTILVGSEPLGEERFDVVFEASGAPPAFSPGLHALRRGGTMVQLGMPAAGDHPVDVSPLVARELIYRGSFRCNAELDEAITMLDDHAWLESIVTHEFGLDDLVSAFDLASDPRQSSKVVVTLRPHARPGPTLGAMLARLRSRDVLLPD